MAKFKQGNLLETARPVWVVDGLGNIVDFTAMKGDVANILVDTDLIEQRILRMYDDHYKPVLVYPTLANGATIVSSTVNWVLGAAADVVPVGTFHNPFLLHTVTVSTLVRAPDVDGVYELVLYHGNPNMEAARVRFSVFGGFYGGFVFNIPSALVPADERIQAAIAYSLAAGTACTATISVAYREIIL